MEKAVYERVGEYVIDKEDSEPFAGGAFGKIFYGRKIGDKKKNYAIKRIEKEGDGETTIDYEKQVAKVLSQIDSPHVLQYVRTVDKPDAFYIITKYCNFGTLEGYIDKSIFLTLPVTRNIFTQMAEGLRSLHSIGVIHRDMKPENVLLHKENDDLTAVLADFGLAAVLKNKKQMSTRVGTQLTMAPEQLNNKKTDWKIDIWAMGVILYRMCFRCYPFDGRVHEQVMEGKYKIPKHFAISKECINTIEKCMQYDPNNRPSAKDLFEKDAFITTDMDNQELYFTYEDLILNIKGRLFEGMIERLVKDRKIVLCSRKKPAGT